MTNYREVATLSKTREILEKHGPSFKKSLDQNFLTEPSILGKIVETAGINQQTNAVEVRPGIGTLAEQLTMNAAQVVVFEIDDRLIPVSADILSRYDNVIVVHRDALKADLVETTSRVFQEKYPIKVVANLSYYITTPIMTHFLEFSLDVAEMAVMIQKEVADRIAAKPGTKAYGSLSIAIQYFMKASVAFTVPKTVSVPQPNVDSAITKLARHATPAVTVTNEKEFSELIKASFRLKRETLWDNLTHSYGKDEQTVVWLKKSLAEAEIDPSRRGETLSLEEFARLSNALEENKPV